MTARSARGAQVLRDVATEASDDAVSRRGPVSGVRTVSEAPRSAPRTPVPVDADHSPESLHEGFAHVASQVIPRLLAAHARDGQAAPATRVAYTDEAPTAAEIEDLASRAVAGDAPGCDRLVEEAEGRGRTAVWIITELIPAVARRLGNDWEEDRRSFTDVSIGASTLQRALRRVAPAGALPSRAGIVVLTCLPDEQHTLAVFMLGEYLQYRGWRTHVEPNLDEEELLDLIRQEPVVAVGLSVNHDDLLPDATELCAILRAQAPGVGILLGGAADVAPLADATGAFACTSREDAEAWLARLADP